jgi:hypothetical protein
MSNIYIICHRTSRKFKDINFIPFPKKFEIREKLSKALKLTEHDLKGRQVEFALFISLVANVWKMTFRLSKLEKNLVLRVVGKILKIK